MRKMNLVVSVLGALTLGIGSIAGCGPDVPGACKSLSSAICAQYNACAPFLLQLAYGDQATCEERAAPECTAWPELTGATIDAGAIQKCADAYKAASCDDVFNGAPEECRVAGTKADGAVCANGLECEGLICDADKEGSCGACGTILDAGAACDPAKSYCDTGLYCDSTSKKCTTRVASGGSCANGEPCAGNLACNSGKCGAPLAAGADCSMGDCDIAHGLYCNPISVKCEKLALAKAGASCGIDLMTGAATACEGGAQCSADAMSPMGTCQAAPQEGDSCVVDSQTGSSDCATGLQCVGGTCSTDLPTCK